MTLEPAITNDPANGPPDWAAIDRDVLCPLCEYNLRGLAAPRCPECGYAFAWGELLEPQTRLQEYLFESRPERNAWAFFRTITADLRPVRFWDALAPTQRPNGRRLVLYWLFAAVPAAVLAAYHAYLASDGYRPPTLLHNALVYTLRELAVELFNRQSYGLTASVQHALAALVLLACLAWPWLTLAALLVFQQSMRQANVNRVHVLRCVVYSADVVFWLGWLSSFVLLNQFRSQQAWSREVTGWFYLAVAGSIAWMTWRLIVAYGRYLRFDRPVATVLAAQAIVVLVLIVIAFAVPHLT